MAASGQEKKAFTVVIAVDASAQAEYAVNCELKIFQIWPITRTCASVVASITGYDAEDEESGGGAGGGEGTEKLMIVPRVVCLSEIWDSKFCASFCWNLDE